MSHTQEYWVVLSSGNTAEHWNQWHATKAAAVADATDRARTSHNTYSIYRAEKLLFVRGAEPVVSKIIV